MKDYWYIVLIEGQILRNSYNINDNEGKRSDEVPNLWWELGSLPWYERGFDEVVDRIE